MFYPLHQRIDIMDRTRLVESATEVSKVVGARLEAGMANGTYRGKTFVIIFARRTAEPPYFETLYVAVFGDQQEENWQYPFSNIAFDKASLTGRTGLPSRTVQLERRELLIPGDTPYYGSWIGELDNGDEPIIAGAGYEDEVNQAICDDAGSRWLERLRRDQYPG